MAYIPEVVKTRGLEIFTVEEISPLSEVVTMDQIKEHLNIELNDDSNNQKLDMLKYSAIHEVETYIQKNLKLKRMIQSYIEINGTIDLYYGPVSEIETVKDSAGNDLSHTVSDLNNKITAYNSGGMVVTFIGGYSPLPYDIQNAVLDIIAVDFDNSVEDKKLAIRAIKERIRHYRPVYV
jgi:hypothetical protein